MSRAGFMDVSQSTDLATFKRNVVSMSAELGFPLVGCVLARTSTNPGKPRITHCISNTPDAYAASSANADLIRRDPVIRWLRTRDLQPVSYNQAFYVKAGAADIWEEQAPFGFCCGVAVSFNLPDNWRFLFGIDRKESAPKGAKLVALQTKLLLFAMHAQAAASRLLTPESAGVRLPPAQCKLILSARELECLNWTRDAKTAWEVGKILSISERTVNAHISNAMQKLECVNKHQAVLKAIDLGLIA